MDSHAICVRANVLRWRDERVTVGRLDCELWTMTDFIKYFCLAETLMDLCVF